jgi:hypothetical protein
VRIEVLDAAQQDLVSGYAFYESQSAGLGSYFLNSLLSEIDSLRLFAGVHEVHFERYHRQLAKRFPFAIYYQVAVDVVRVYAVLDCRQSPRAIADRVKK